MENKCCKRCGHTQFVQPLRTRYIIDTSTGEDRYSDYGKYYKYYCNNCGLSGWDLDELVKDIKE